MIINWSLSNRYTNFNNIKSIIRKFETLKLFSHFYLWEPKNPSSKKSFLIWSKRSKKIAKRNQTDQEYQTGYQRFVVNASCHERSLCVVFCILLNEFFVFLLWIGFDLTKEITWKIAKKNTQEPIFYLHWLLREVTWIFHRKK